MENVKRKMDSEPERQSAPRRIFSNTIKILCLENHIKLIESIRSVSEIFEFSEEYIAELDESIACLREIKNDIYFEAAMGDIAQKQLDANNL